MKLKAEGGSPPWWAALNGRLCYADASAAPPAWLTFSSFLMNPAITRSRMISRFPSIRAADSHPVSSDALHHCLAAAAAQ